MYNLGSDFPRSTPRLALPGEHGSSGIAPAEHGDPRAMPDTTQRIRQGHRGSRETSRTDRSSVGLGVLLYIVSLMFANVSSATVWSPQSEIDPRSESVDWYPTPAITPDGTVWVVWQGRDPVELDHEIYYSRWSGQAWDEAKTVHPPNLVADEIAKLACAPDGALWVFWSAPTPGAAGYYLGLASRWNGTGWTSPDTVWTDRDRYNNYDFAPVSADEAWFIREGQGSILVYHRSGEVNDPVHGFDIPSAAGRQPTIVVDAQGEIWAAWTHDFPLDQDDPLEWSRRVGGTWQEPQTLPLPVGAALPRITVGAQDEKWIICAGRDPATTYFGGDIWAVRWNGSSWDPATRISDPIQLNDSIQVYNATSRTPGEHPRVVWLRASIWNYTRRDILTTAWDGTAWSPVELVGSLADSAYQEWPDVAARGEQVWVTWMQEPKVAPYALSAVSIHAIPATTGAFGANFDVSPVPGGARLAWSVETPSAVARLRILRATGRVPGGTAPLSALVVADLDSRRVRAGTLVDRDIQSSGEYTYWLSVLTTQDRAAWLGPRFALVELRPIRSRLRLASPNPSGPGVLLQGTVGIGEPRKIVIYGVDGRLVRGLQVRREVLPGTGTFSVPWDGKRDDGSPAASGLYFARLLTSGPGDSEGTVRIILVR